jgi:hypothetical protein
MVMKMEATIKVEFEAEPGQPENALAFALARGLDRLKIGIEYGTPGAGRTGIKRGSVKAEIVDKKLV